MKYVLGISAFYHDSAAALIGDGKILAAAQEERFTRKKHDSAFPAQSIRFCLDFAKIDLKDVDAVVFYDKPFLKFDRLLETYFSNAPRGFTSFCASMPVWLKEKLFLKNIIRQSLADLSGLKKTALPPLFFDEHHHSHAASAFYPSPFAEAAVLCIDGVGEWSTTTAWAGKQNSLTPIWEIEFPHSLGLLYSAFTYFCGFKVNSGEYKLMGLAPYGQPVYKDIIYDKLITLKPDGSFRLNMKYFSFATGLRMTNRHFDDLFGGPPRNPESPLTDREMNLAASVQEVLEEIVLKLAQNVALETGLKNLCLAGGVALNCVANGKLLRSGIFENIWIQPAAGDAGGALGCALGYWHEHLSEQRQVASPDAMSGSLLGPAIDDETAKAQLMAAGAVIEELPDEQLFEKAVKFLEDGKVIGWVQGRMEFGPRALGSRSILGDARNTAMQSTMNLKIKYRESFRPFAPIVLKEDQMRYFDLKEESPYMLLVAQVSEDQKLSLPQGYHSLGYLERLKTPRSQIPAVTHLDNSARVQSVDSLRNPRLHNLMTNFKKKTGCSVLVNTSFNVRGEPIVCTAEDAYRCFMRTEMDALIVNNLVIEKSKQSKRIDDMSWKKEFELD